MENFEVRDLREKDQFKIDDKFLNGYAKYVEIYAVGVYNSLCRHAQYKSQRAFPSIKKIAEELNISSPKVFYSLWVLEFFNIIKRYRVGKKCNNRYDLLHKKHWKSPEKIKQELEQEFKELNIDINKVLNDKDKKGHVKAVNITDVKAVNIRYKGSLYHVLRQLTSIVRITNSKDNKSNSLSATADEVYNSMKQPIKKRNENHSTDQPDKNENFNSNNYIEEMTKNNKKHICIIGWYFQSTKMRFPSLKAVKAEIGRHLKEASILAEYEDGQVAKAVEYVKRKFPEEWKLSTVLKYINKI